MSIKSIQGWRFVLFMAIFLFHTSVFGTEITDTLIYQHFLIGGGTAGVCYFFVLSGFLEAIHFNPGEDTKNKIKRKVFRMYIYHLPFLLLTIPFNLINFANNSVMKTINFTINLLLLQSWFPLKNVYLGFNGVAWFLSTLLFLILLRKRLIMVAIYFNKKCGANILILLAAFMCCMSFLLGLFYGELESDICRYWCYIFPLARVMDYFAGICVGRYFLQNTKTIHLSTIWELICVLCFWGLLVAYPYTPFSLSRTAVYLPFALATCYVFAKSDGKVSKFLSKDWIARLGDCGFYFMVSHQVIFRYLEWMNRHLLKNIFSGWTLIVAAFLIMLSGTKIFRIYEKKLFTFLCNKFA